MKEIDMLAQVSVFLHLSIHLEIKIFLRPFKTFQSNVTKILTGTVNGVCKM